MDERKTSPTKSNKPLHPGEQRKRQRLYFNLFEDKDSTSTTTRAKGSHKKLIFNAAIPTPNHQSDTFFTIITQEVRSTGSTNL